MAIRLNALSLRLDESSRHWLTTYSPPARCRLESGAWRTGQGYAGPTGPGGAVCLHELLRFKLLPARSTKCEQLAPSANMPSTDPGSVGRAKRSPPEGK